jgi:hypothetical protein
MLWDETAQALSVTAADDRAGSLTLQRVLSPAPTDPATFDDPGLVGSFELTGFTSDVATPSTTGPHPSAPGLRLTFRDGRVTAVGNCGTSTGSYRLIAGALDVTNLSTVADPAVSCDSDSRRFDDLGVALLGARPVLKRTDDEVSLAPRASGDFGVTVTRVGVPGDPLFEGFTWTMRHYQRPGAAAVPVQLGITATLKYLKGRLSMYAGCNYIGGSAYVADGTIRVQQVASTAMACESPLGDYDNLLTEPFTSAPTRYTVDATTLTIMSSTVTLTFTR